ncbi:MAG: sulfotransferase family protein [Actinomycetia bacterium]|nr:sulfotransferase family protein [Actinomycetes bacterium]
MDELNPDALLAQASETTGLSDLGDDSWREGLERLTDALTDEAKLNELGEAIVTGELVGYLSDRLRLVAHRSAHPEIANVDVVPPIVIMGQARTGTTILHDILAQDPATRAPLTWEVDLPVPPPETATYDDDPRIAQVDATLAGIDLVLPGFRAMHPMGARLPQECVRITSSDFRSMIFPTQYRVPSYAQWLLHETDMRSAYRWHRCFLQHLQSRHPAQRWVLKSPGHIWCIDALLAEYPGALLVQTHRDPVRIIASLGSLVATLRSLASDYTSVREAASEYADYIIDGLDRSVDARENGTVGPERVVDVNFSAFMADPFATIRTVYERLGFELTDDAEARMRAFLAAHGQDEHSSHKYSFADTGLDEGALRERTRRYQDYFDVASEPLS